MDGQPLAWAQAELAEIREDFEERRADLGDLALRVHARLGDDGLGAFADALELAELDAACEALPPELVAVVFSTPRRRTSAPSPHTHGEFYEVVFRHLALAPDLRCARAALQILSYAEDNGDLCGSDILMTLWRTHGEAMRPELEAFRLDCGRMPLDYSVGVTLAALLDGA